MKLESAPNELGSYETVKMSESCEKESKSISNNNYQLIDETRGGLTVW